MNIVKIQHYGTAAHSKSRSPTGIGKAAKKY
jgi:hypothetical protein